jgi:predicted RNase H-like HicB family nuclease
VATWLRFRLLPGCITQGDDTEEAIEMAKETISLYLEELDERAAK